MGIGTATPEAKLDVVSVGIGVRGQVNDIGGIGVVGESTGAEGLGVRGFSTGADGIGVRGISTSSGGIGVFGTNDNHTGVRGTSSFGEGVRGISTSGTGIIGQSSVGTGVHGRSTSSTGVHGQSTSGTGVLGTSNSGVAVIATSDNQPALIATSNTGFGVVGISTSSFGGNFVGAENNGTEATVRIRSGNQIMLLDGNEIDAVNGPLSLNNNSHESVRIGPGPDNDGTIAALLISSTSPTGVEQTMLLNGNEIDVLGGDLHLNHNTSGHVYLVRGGGDVFVNNAMVHGSDQRLKKNITTLDGALDKILNLRGVSFEWKKVEGRMSHPQKGIQIRCGCPGSRSGGS